MQIAMALCGTSFGFFALLSVGRGSIKMLAGSTLLPRPEIVYEPSRKKTSAHHVPIIEASEDEYASITHRYAKDWNTGLMRLNPSSESRCSSVWRVVGKSFNSPQLVEPESAESNLDKLSRGSPVVVNVHLKIGRLNLLDRIPLPSGKPDSSAGNVRTLQFR